MDRILLFIREARQNDIVELHPDEVSARRGLAKYVRERADHDILSTASDEDVLIKAYSSDVTRFYAIVGVAGGDR